MPGRFTLDLGSVSGKSVANSKGFYVTHPTAWDADGLRSKASVFFERAFAAEPDDALFAFWCHLALEHLARAAVAQVSPALLAVPRKQESLLYGLGLAEADHLDPESSSIASVYELCARFVEGFGNAEAATCEEARRRRNAELHSAAAAMESLPRGWLGRFFAACRVLTKHLGVELADLVGADQVAFVDALIVEDATSVQSAVRSAIDSARARAATLRAPERQRLETEAALDLRPRTDALGGGSARQPVSRYPVLREVPCPACGTSVALRGEIVRRGPARIDPDRQLIETQLGIPRLLSCPVCQLRLASTAELTVAGLGDPVASTDYLDPVETFGIDLSDYRDEFLQSLADDYEYQDE